MAVVAGVALHVTAIALLHQLLGIELGRALGLIVLFYLALIPSALACYVIGAAAGRVARVIALALAPVLAAWLAWGLVMHAGASLDAIELPASCYDKQGLHRC